MGRALSNDLRSRVLQASSEGATARRAAIRFGVSASTAIRWISRAQQGELEARLTGWRRGSKLDFHEDYIVALIDERKDITLNEIVVCLREECGISIERTAMNNWLRKRGFTYKKRLPMHWSRNSQSC